MGYYVSQLICTLYVMEHRQRKMLQVFLSISFFLFVIFFFCMVLVLFIRPNVIRSFVLLKIQSPAAMRKVVVYVQAKQFR